MMVVVGTDGVKINGVHVETIDPSFRHAPHDPNLDRWNGEGFKIDAGWTGWDAGDSATESVLKETVELEELSESYKRDYVIGSELAT